LTGASHTVDDVLEAVREVAERELAPASSAIDREGRFPEAGLRALGEVGALGLLVGPEHGGVDGGLGSLATACELVGAACASTGMVFLMHNVAAATVKGAGGPAADEVLPKLAAGEVIGTLAFSERGTGAHFYSPELRAVRTNGSVHVSGRKSFVTAGGHADAMVVLVQSEVDGLDCYVVNRDAEGVSFDGVWAGIGMRGNSSIAVNFDDVTIAPDARLGAPGSGADTVFGVVAPAFLVGLAGVNVGIAQAALSVAVAHVRDRTYPDGQTLADLPTIQHQLADMDIRTRSSRALLTEAAALADGGDDGALVPLMEAKISCTDTSAAVTQAALEVCGGQGYTSAMPIERHLRDARAGAVMAPTNGVLRTWTGKALAGLPVP
jgi:isovaleryl-CoA dehydrogenase